MHFPDVPVLATLLGANLRRGRDVSAFDGAASLKVYQDAAAAGELDDLHHPARESWPTRS